MVHMAAVLAKRAFVIRVGPANSALRSSATRAAATTANARTALASVSLVGTDDTARWKAVRGDAPATGSAA